MAEAVLKKTNVELSGIYVPMKLTVIEDRESENEEGIRFYDQMVQSIAQYANSQNKVTAADLFSNDPFHIWMERMSKKCLAPPARYPIPTGWYYERARKKYQQEQVKLSKSDILRFTKKFPKEQIITKEQLAMYLTALSCKPHIVSRGKNWVMKEFGRDMKDEYRKNKAGFNEFYFKRCICATIVYRTVDQYLEKNKDSAKKPTGFWYKTGGYKLNIVPYTVAKIMSNIPPCYSLDWNRIWQRQSLSAAFMREIEIVTKMTNDFICDSSGVIVTEYCKRDSTWEKYKEDKRYTPSKEFLDELVPVSMVKEEEATAKNEQKETNELQLITGVISAGPAYWNALLEEGIKKKLLSYQEQSLIKQVVQLSLTGNIPASSSGKVPYKTMNMIRSALSIRDKLESEGILINNGEQI